MADAARNVPLIFRPADQSSNEPPTHQRVARRRVAARRHDPSSPGYLRKNGVPYSENVTLTEHWELFKRPNGEEWLTITQQIEDPQNLRNAKLAAPIFKKEPNGAKWDPTPCSSRW